MTVRLYFDQNINDHLAKPLHEVGVEIVTACEDGRDRQADEPLLERCVELDALIVTHDEDFLVNAVAWQRNGRDFPGVGFTRQRRFTNSQLFGWLEFIAKVGQPDDFANQVKHLPLSAGCGMPREYHRSI